MKCERDIAFGTYYWDRGLFSHVVIALEVECKSYFYGLIMKYNCDFCPFIVIRVAFFGATHRKHFKLLIILNLYYSIII